MHSLDSGCSAVPPGRAECSTKRPCTCRLKQYFQDWRIRGLFSFQDLYVGLSPYSAPGVYSLLAGTELTDGVWYPLGGFGKVTGASQRNTCRHWQHGALGVHTLLLRLADGMWHPTSSV